TSTRSRPSGTRRSIACAPWSRTDSVRAAVEDAVVAAGPAGLADLVGLVGAELGGEQLLEVVAGAAQQAQHALDDAALAAERIGRRRDQPGALLRELLARGLVVGRRRLVEDLHGDRARVEVVAAVAAELLVEPAQRGHVRLVLLADGLIVDRAV